MSAIDDLLRQVQALEKRIALLETHEVHASWVDWTPAIDQGGAVACTVTEAKYMLVGHLCHVQANLLVTAAGTGGNAIIIGGQPAAIQAASSTAYMPLGEAVVTDTGTAIYAGTMVVTAATAWRILRHSTNDYIGVNPNMALANTDTIQFELVYRVA